MLKKVLFTAVAVAMSVGLAGCGKTAEEKAQAKADDGNVKMSQIRTLMSELQADGVNVAADSQETSIKNMESMSDSDLANTIARLEKINRLTSEVSAIVDSDEIVTISGSKEDLKRALRLVNGNSSTLVSEARSIRSKRQNDAA